MPTGMAESPPAPAAAAGTPMIASPVGRLISSDSIPVGGFTPGMVLAERYRIIGLLGRGCRPSERVATRLSLTAGTSRKDVRVASDLSLEVPSWEVEKTVCTGHAGRIVAYPEMCLTEGLLHFFIGNVILRVGRYTPAKRSSPCD